MIIEIEEKEEHDEIVEKVVKRLVKNNLYIKPEKCKWKILQLKELRVVQ